MLKTLERYQKCSYGSLEVNNPGKEIEICRQLLGDELGPLNINGLEHIEHQLETSLKHIRSTRTQAMLDQLSKLQAKEKTMLDGNKGLERKMVLISYSNPGNKATHTPTISMLPSHATITDGTESADAVFFNDSMQDMPNISCEEMVTKHANTTNPSVIPQELRSAVYKPRRLHLTLKNDGKVVNNVSNGALATDRRQSTSTGTPTFTPATQLSKAATSKRQLTETPGQDKKFKQS
ncbi:hypothetical protein CASFOL_020626 [Castilleja foliolosa]|uniref:K-box domain-containing protein n=1 Tax=Castilleja foliolosa TaxID=1961234 RepID=A0ABD3D465_9LAMI